MGNAATNGTVGTITTRPNNTIAPNRSFLGSYTQDNIRIITPQQGQLSPEFPPAPTRLAVPPLPNRTPIVTLEDAREVLRRIEVSTGVKPALIYVSFVPTALVGDPSFTRREETLTQDFQTYLGLPDATTPSIVSPEKQGSDPVELLLLTQQGKPIYKRLPNATRSRVLKVAREFRTNLTNRRLPIRPQTYLASAQRLYQWFVAPLEQELHAQNIQNLVFIMDTGLRSVPLAALHDGTDFIVAKYSVGLMPTLSLTDTRYSDVRNAQVLAMGATKFTNQKPLPAVPVELSLITNQLWPGRAFLNEAFTLDNLQQARALHSYSIVHLATHAEFQPGMPGNSYIQLWNRKLPLSQIRQLGLNNPPVDLLVLSACRTALGDKNAELGFAGLAVQAGVKSGLGSLWYVNDEATMALMTEFYEQLKQVPIKAEALRRAQMSMREGKVRLEGGQLITSRGSFPLPPELAELGDKDLSHPYYWSGFTMIGSPW